jgi:hypothetical protein
MVSEASEDCSMSRTLLVRPPQDKIVSQSSGSETTAVFILQFVDNHYILKNSVPDDEFHEFVGLLLLCRSMRSK